MKLEVTPQSTGCDYTKQVRVADWFNKIHFSQIVNCSKNNEIQKKWWWNRSQGKIKVLLWKLCERVHVKNLLYDATFVFGYISFAAVFKGSMTIKTLDFLCSKCAVTRKLVEPTAESSAYSKIQSVHTSCNNLAPFAGRNAFKKVEMQLQTSWELSKSEWDLCHIQTNQKLLP